MSLRNSRLGSNYKLQDGREVTNGAAHVRPLPGPQTQSRNRNLVTLDLNTHPADDLSNTVTWNASDNITELTILVTATDSATAPPLSSENYVVACFNAGSAAIAAAWLDETLSSKTDDVQFYKFQIGVPQVFRFTSAVTRCDILPINVSTTISAANAWIGAN